MDRRTFLTIFAVAAAIPGGEATDEPRSARLAELIVQLRARFGDDTDEILATARRAIAKVVAEHPEIDRKTEEGLERLTDLAFDEATRQLNEIGIELGGVLA